LAADVLTDEADETALGHLAELLVVGGFLADHESSAVIARVEPFACRRCGADGAIKPHPRTHFDERTTLRKFCRFFEFHADQGDPLIVLENADGTHGHFIASFGLADGSPVPGREDHQTDHQHRRQHYGNKNNEGFLQRCFRKAELQRDTLFEKGDSVNRLCKFPDNRFMARAMVMAQSRSADSVISMETFHSTLVTSPVGTLFLAASGRGLVALEFDARFPGQQTIRPNPRDLRVERRKSKEVRFEESDRALHVYAQQLEEYFAGERRDFNFDLDLRGTDFQLACWRALLAIPYGETRSYADIARAVGRPHGFRAVGMANNRNPLAIVVPCHRVIASDGTLCGYGGGLDVKRKLLELEGTLTGILAA
jgi:methylated-DNA-[protein]-cysteine S-methyltransferase